ncbi:hypothetical protein [Carboxylicivirga sp. RSCT41]|uniref:hypothetical protein n=1 Tax=Carboxylicivirga agarovorans TaxID=3417570 RepID=UPI003D355519
MKKTILLIGLILQIIVNSCTMFQPSYEFTYIYSSDSLNVITRIDHESSKGYAVYFTPGKFSEKKIPEEYIKTHNTGFFDGFHLAINWKGDTCTVINLSGGYEVENLSEKFVYLDDIDSIETSLKELLVDTTNYIQVFSKNPIFE